MAVAVGYVLSAAPALAGTYHLTVTDLFPPFAVAHPAAYDGNGGPIEIKVCIPPGPSEILRPAAEEAMEIWNSLWVTPENCPDCRTLEQGAPEGEELFSMRSVILHELGHCGLGIDHTNWEGTSHTATESAMSFSAGADGIPGSADDRPSPLPGSRLVHWFRTLDNDAFTFTPPVDASSYSRRILDLPSGSSWPANANVATAPLIGLEDSQATMYSSIAPGAVLLGLAGDEVNTVSFAMSGVDEMAGTADDYAPSFVQTNCDSADVELSFGDVANPDLLGFCLVDMVPLPTMGIDIHFSLTPLEEEERALVVIDESRLYDVIFANGFETGSPSAWSVTSP